MDKLTKLELIESLQKLCPYTLKGCPSSNKAAELVADFILADRKRICEPLVKYRELLADPEKSMEYNSYNSAIDETLKLAGVEDEN